ncbi:MAG TPA: NHL repeat-containing protein, partial [Candidatus Binataceae bacterium]|nr:NHL repeat-containing protein [Candidatus Binataceae bacterium]
SSNIYVTDRDSSSVLIYPQNSNGNVAPVATIGGSNTILESPSGITVDSTGKIYVADGDLLIYAAVGSSTGLINKFPLALISVGLGQAQSVALDSSSDIYVTNAIQVEAGEAFQGGNEVLPFGGNVLEYQPLGTCTGLLAEGPLATISATANAGFPEGIATDSSGKIYVAVDEAAAYSPGSVLVYAPGDTAPSATIGGSNTGLFSPGGIAVDSYGNIYVAAGGPAANTLGSVLIYSPGSTGNSAPIATIGGGDTGMISPIDIALDSSGKIYVLDEYGPKILVYSSLGSSTGLLDKAPLVAISGGNTGLSYPYAIAVDSGGQIYVSDGDPPSLLVYSEGSNGDVAPTSVISGSNTGLISPVGIAVDAAGDIYVGDENARTVFVYSAGSSGNVAPVSAISGPNTQLFQPDFVAIESVEPPPMPTPTASPTNTPIATPMPTVTSTATTTATPTPTRTPTFTASPTKTPTVTARPTSTPTPTSTLIPTVKASPTPTMTTTRVSTPTPIPTATAAAGVTLLPSVLNFGTIAVSQSSVPSSVTLSNGSAKKLTLRKTTIGQDFVIVSTTCSPSLGAGQSCDYSISFEPLKAGSKNETFKVFDNAIDSPQMVTLQGTATR